MSMFRPKIFQSEMSLDKFGVGSYISEPGITYLVISTAEQYVELLNMNTMCTLKHSIQVEDINYLKEDEVRDLVGRNLVDAFSDYEYDPIGLKQL